MIGNKQLELLQFNAVLDLIKGKCFSQRAKQLCLGITPGNNSETIVRQLNQTNELKLAIASNAFFPSTEYDDTLPELNLLSLDGSLVHEADLLKVKKTTEVCNTLVRYIKGKKQLMPFVFDVFKNEGLLTRLSILA